MDNPANNGTSSDGPMRLARCMGWFSIGLGAVELIAPGTLARALGMEGRESLIQGYGAREVATGVALLSASNPAPWMWGRVAGDALDLLTLARGLEDGNPENRNVGLALAAVAGVTAVDMACAAALGRPPGASVERVTRDRSGYPVPIREAHGLAVRSDAEPYAIPVS